MILAFIIKITSFYLIGFILHIIPILTLENQYLYGKIAQYTNTPPPKFYTTCTIISFFISKKYDEKQFKANRTYSPPYIILKIVFLPESPDNLCNFSSGAPVYLNRMDISNDTVHIPYSLQSFSFFPAFFHSNVLPMVIF